MLAFRSPIFPERRVNIQAAKSQNELPGILIFLYLATAGRDIPLPHPPFTEFGVLCQSKSRIGYCVLFLVYAILIYEIARSYIPGLDGEVLP